MARKKKSGDSESPDERTNLSDDTFGLPEIHYEPIRKDKEEQEEVKSEPVSESREEDAREETPITSSAEPESTGNQPAEPEVSANEYEPEPEPVHKETFAYSEDRPSPLWPKILALIVVLILAGAAVYYFLVFKPKKDEEERKRQLALQEQMEADRKRKEEEERLRLLQEERERRIRDSLAALSKTGTIEKLEERTGRYYVVITSAVDGDLIMDYAKKLSDKGVNTKIIPPFGKYKFYRLAVDEGDSFMAAQAKAEGLKQEYGNAVWVLKY
ncbi:MAG: DUF4366 domain-containing protein [Cyclobacteriaceae bacterium]|nr:DUF4366 domain-containing protein [Cyclobacteriaceae bacterium]MCX7638150.1 DUF4366 domain-containing protein [Cyclobacteriaceae bacterium]MDW8332131.1 hypothetical protein [Cyclobacteriaceae bacterium]